MSVCMYIRYKTFASHNNKNTSALVVCQTDSQSPVEPLTTLITLMNHLNNFTLTVLSSIIRSMGI